MRATTRIVSAFLVLLLLARCGKPDSATIEIRLPALVKKASNVGGAPATGAAPSGTTGFDCYAVNVMGSNITETGTSPFRKPLDQVVANTTKCSYPGKMSSLISITQGGTVQLDVPRGLQRVVQVLGVISPGGCSLNDPLSNHFDKAPSTTSDPVYPGVYELGRSLVDLSADTAVTITNTYNASASPQDVRCGYINVDCNDSANTGATPTGSGNGPYRICTAAQLAHLTSHPTFSYTLEKNIDLSGSGILPLTTLASPFSGTFDGQGFALSNFTYTTGFASGIGLFGSLDNGGTIKNLALPGVSITASTSQPVGALLGYMGNTAAATVTGVSAAGTITFPGITNDTGGLIGLMTAGTVSKSSANVTIIGSTSSFDAGGLIGKVTQGTIDRCSAKGDVTWTNKLNVGGLIGLVNIGAGQSVTITRSYATGNVTGGTGVGGFVGQFLNTSGTGTVAKCYSTGTVASMNPSSGTAGGFTGTTATAISFSTSYSSTATVTAAAPSPNKGGFNGAGPTGSFTAAYSNAAVTPAGTGSVGTFAITGTALFNASSYTGFDFGNDWTINETVSTPTLR